MGGAKKGGITGSDVFLQKKGAWVAPLAMNQGGFTLNESVEGAALLAQGIHTS